jgi:hypothetical protein
MGAQPRNFAGDRRLYGALMEVYIWPFASGVNGNTVAKV